MSCPTSSPSWIAAASLQVGLLDELYERPRSLFVAQFLDESNLLGGFLTEVVREMAIFASDKP